MIRRITYLLVILISACIFSGISTGLKYPSVSAQTIPNLGWSDEYVNTQPYGIPVIRTGNLQISPVFLDGKVVGTIATSVNLISNQSDDPDNAYDSATRSFIMHSRLQKILDNMTRYSKEVLSPQGMTLDEQKQELRKQLVLTSNQVNDTTVVFIAFPKDDVPEIIYSVTKADIERPRFGGSQPAIVANSAAAAIEAGLIQAWDERQIPYLSQQWKTILLVFPLLLLTSVGLSQVQKRLKVRKSFLYDCLTKSENDYRNESQSITLPHDSIHKDVGRSHENYRRSLKLSLSQRYSFNKLYLSGLFWGQCLLWLLGIGYLTSLLYWSRPFSNWIVGVTIPGYWSTRFLTGWPPVDWILSFGQKATIGTPLMILFLLLGTQLTLKIGDATSDWFAHRWSQSNASDRNILRVPTVAKALKSWLRVVAYLILGVIIGYHFYQLSSVTQVLAITLGFLSFALSLASQDLLKDLISGVLILWEDQFVVGDVIAIDDKSGLVENITLRVTKLRNLDGELITIPNRKIATVKNLSSEWSRVNYAVEVGYDADVDKAMQIIEEIAQGLYHDPEWQNLILESPEILGVENIAHTGTLIRLLIKTEPLQQWPVGREFRRRLKKAFDQHGVDIGVPKQQMYLQPIEKLVDEGHEFSSGEPSKLH